MQNSRHFRRFRETVSPVKSSTKFLKFCLESDVVGGARARGQHRRRRRSQESG